MTLVLFVFTCTSKMFVCVEGGGVINKTPGKTKHITEAFLYYK